MTDLNSMTKEQLVAHIAKLEAAAKAKVTLKVTEKGAVSLYGIGRFPATYYRSQWDTILANVDTIRDFIEANASRLSVKGE